MDWSHLAWELPSETCYLSNEKTGWEDEGEDVGSHRMISSKRRYWNLKQEILGRFVSGELVSEEGMGLSQDQTGLRHFLAQCNNTFGAPAYA